MKSYLRKAKKRFIEKEKNSLFLYLFIIMSIGFVDFIVYKSGGTEFSLTHLMYVPIIFAAYFFGTRGSLIAAFIAGISLGPLMPVNVKENIMQSDFGWLFRMISFVFLSVVVGFLFDKIYKDYQMQIRKSYENYQTGLPNGNKLRADLRKKAQSNGNYSMLIFYISNLDYINRYIDEATEEKIVKSFTNLLYRHFEKGEIYCESMKKFIVIKNNKDKKYIYEKAQKFINIFEQPILVDEIHVDLYVKCGIVSSPKDGKNPNELIKKLFRSLDQKSDGKNEIYVYKSEEAKKNKENYEKLIELYDALNNGEMYLVYQPKIALNVGRVMGFEALIRWKSPKFGNVSPEEFIALAEYAGIINEITKWVIEKVAQQIKIWNEMGYDIKVAINISSKDLKNDDIIIHTLDSLEKNQVNPGLFEFELTERTIAENEESVYEILEKIRNMGLKISLDDFGTGYNSLIHLVNLPIDYVKLDKFFITRMKEEKGKPLVQGVINTVHTLGKQIIAEGVETEEQVAMLVKMGCDNIQGYYYSKPLMADDVIKYINNVDTCA